MEVKVYSTPTCPYCDMAKEHLSSKNVVFKEFDVSDDRVALEEMVKVSGQRGVPVLVINGKVVVGFDEEKIDSLLK